MTQDSSISLSASGVNEVYHNKRLPTGIHIVGTEVKSVSKEGSVSSIESENCKQKVCAPWGYIFIHHMSVATFEKKLETCKIEGDFKPNCFVHRTIRYKKSPQGKGIIKEEKPTISGLVFLQGETEQLRAFLIQNYPQYFLVNDCTTGKPASIPDSIMRPFMQIMKNEPERVTFLRDPFVKFAHDHVKLRVLTGIMAGQEGYVVRILKNRQLVMDFGGYAVAINNVHNEDFEIAE